MKDEKEKRPSKRVTISMSDEYQAMALIDKAMDLVHSCTRDRVLRYAIVKHLGSGASINKYVRIKTGTVNND